jgi:hypothetical protein
MFIWAELDREDMIHHEFMLTTDFRLHLSPIGDSPQRILDIGTGTGGLLYAIGAINQNEAEYPNRSLGYPGWQVMLNAPMMRRAC